VRLFCGYDAYANGQQVLPTPVLYSVDNRLAFPAIAKQSNAVFLELIG
jgi:hypothetical protein